MKGRFLLKIKIPAETDMFEVSQKKPPKPSVQQDCQDAPNFQENYIWDSDVWLGWKIKLWLLQEEFLESVGERGKLDRSKVNMELKRKK